ncbi:high-potential iron-sulfur protein [Burkholderia stagnalis]
MRRSTASALQVAAWLTIASTAPETLAAGSTVSETDDNARALGYRADAKRVDRAQYPAYQPGQQCSNCTLFQRNGDAAEGRCTLFGHRAVQAAGWCAGYVAAAG